MATKSEINPFDAFIQGLRDGATQNSYELGHKVAQNLARELGNTPEGWRPPGADEWDKHVQSINSRSAPPTNRSESPLLPPHAGKPSRKSKIKGALTFLSELWQQEHEARQAKKHSRSKPDDRQIVDGEFRVIDE